MTKMLIELDGDLVRRAVEYSGASTEDAVVEMALEEFVRRRALDRYVDFARSGALDDLADPDVIASAQR